MEFSLSYNTYVLGNRYRRRTFALGLDHRLSLGQALVVALKANLSLSILLFFC